MKLSHLFCVVAIFGVGCGGAIAQDLGGGSDSGTQEGDSAVVHPTNGRDAGELLDGSTHSADASSHFKDAAQTDANPSFACGDVLTCDRQTQICKEGEGGPPGNPPSFQCDPIPVACVSDLTCDCMKKTIGANACSITDGAVTVQFFYP